MLSNREVQNRKFSALPCLHILVVKEKFEIAFEIAKRSKLLWLEFFLLQDISNVGGVRSCSPAMSAFAPSSFQVLLLAFSKDAAMPMNMMLRRTPLDLSG